MEKNKTKFYLLIAGIFGIILIPIIYTVKDGLKSEELNNKGIKTEAIIEDKTRSRNMRTRTFHYSLSLKYSDENDTEYNETIPINYEIFRTKGIGQKIEILYLPENPTEFILVDYKKLYDTQERVLEPNDLLAFYESRNLEYIYNELNKISNGWLLHENDSTLFLNSRRNSFIYVRNDSIAYYTGVQNEKDVSPKLGIYKKIKSERIKKRPININPFEPRETPKNNYEIPMPVSHYQKDYFNFYASEIIDFSNRPWFSLVLKK